MGVISRGIKNAFRNTVRTVSITFILGLSVALALIMLLALKTVQAKITSIKSSIGNTITVSPAGIRGFEGGGEALTSADAATLSTIQHVSKVVQAISDHIMGSDTNLKSAMEAGSFGKRQQMKIRDNGTGRVENQDMAGITMPVMVIGTNDLSVTSNLNVSKFDVTGEKFDANSTDDVALVGTDLASKNNLTAGSTFQAYGKDIKVTGIFDGGNKFANASFVMPIKALQALSSQADQVTSIIVQADSIDSISSVESAIKDKIGSKADIVSAQDSSSEAVKPLENIKTISLYSLIGALAAGSVIILLTMIMIVRERRREIGVLKAIGSSNIKVVSQFTVESLVLTLLSSALGIILGFLFANPVLKVLVNNSENGGGGDTIQTAARQHGMMMRLSGGISNAGNVLKDIHAVVGADVILYGLAAAILIAVIGSAIPAFFIAKVRPAEVMRAE